MKTRAAVGTVLFLAWLAVTYYAPTWPTGWVLGACGAVVIAANGGRPDGKITAGWVTTGPPAIAAAAGTAAWVVIGEALNYPAPSEWGRWIASAVGIVWVVCIIAGSVWDGGPTRRRRPRGKATPLREAIAAAGIPALAIPDDGRAVGLVVLGVVLYLLGMLVVRLLHPRGHWSAEPTTVRHTVTDPAA